MKSRRHIITTIAALLLGTAAFAVLNEKDLSQTLTVLRGELHEQNAKMERLQSRMRSRNDQQHNRMVSMIQRCNEYALVLYSQNQDFTFDVTYSLRQATKEYENFNKRKMPFDEIIERMDLEIDRYERLIESLRRIPPVLDKEDDVPDSIALSTDSLRMQSTVRGRPGGPRIPVTNAQREILGPGNGSRPELQPVMLDSLGQINRDSCMYYAKNLLAMYKRSRDKVAEDSKHYTETNERLKENYDYAQTRYKELQRSMLRGQDSYLRVLRSPKRYGQRAFEEARDKYDSNFSGYSSAVKSEWRGPIVTGFILYVLGYLVIASLLSLLIVLALSKAVKAFRTPEFRQRRTCITILIGAVIFTLTIIIGGALVTQNFFAEAGNLLLVFAVMLMIILSSLLIHLAPEQINGGMKLYLPVILLGLVVLTFRIILIPNRLVTLLLTPTLAIFLIWQAILVGKQRKKVKTADVAYSSSTLFIMTVALILAFSGYVLLSIAFIIWWLFQLTALHAVTAIHDLCDRYEAIFIHKSLQEQGRHFTKEDLKRGEYIRKTWLFDFVKTVLVPVVTVLSLPFCLYMAAKVFDLTSIVRNAFTAVFFSIPDSAGNVVLKLSVDRIVIVTCLFFVFRYLAYIGRAFYKILKINAEKKARKVEYIRDNEVNLTLANNVIGIIVWAVYIIIFVMVFRIPLGSISVIFAGLAAGLGLALKDILNNFIYGIQLMGGRVRVGDTISCDGIRGQVDKISYQSTSIEAEDGSLISFTNTTLFNKNFKNLTRNSPYEFIGVVVGVAYGTDVDVAKKVLLDALQPLLTKRDKYDRLLIEPKYGIKVTMADLGDSSVNLKAKMFVLVEDRHATVSQVYEIMYKALGESGIEIPFPQRDIHIKKD
ncbi:MAG: mechanosensitive ion channel family protein [Bacteroidales bacterium]|nr:mechanosensitive ion channel family protein [Bacteroidales bacterium]